jgi:16S rRNA processing protein RimM
LTSPDGLLEIGRITKPHGVRGEVVVDLVTDRRERVAPGTRLASDRGELHVLSSRPHQGKWLVMFEGYPARTAVARLAGVVLRAEPLDDPDALWVHELVGAQLVEADGTERGRVVAVVENPAHDLLELDSGALVPIVFVRGDRPTARTGRRARRW